MLASPRPLILVLAAVFDRCHAHLHLLFERRDRLLHRAQRIERRRRHHVIHPIVEVLDPEPRLIERKIAVLRIFRDLGVGQPPQGAVLVAHDRPEALEAGAAERRILREQEIAAPEALARDRSVGLRRRPRERRRPRRPSAERAARAPECARTDRRRRFPDAASPASAAPDNSRCCCRSAPFARSRNERRRRRSARIGRTMPQAPMAWGGFARRAACSRWLVAAGLPNRSRRVCLRGAADGVSGAGRRRRLEILNVEPLRHRGGLPPPPRVHFE